MPDKKIQPTVSELTVATVLGNFATLPFQWVADTYVNRQIVNSASKASYFNIGLGWEITYRLCTTPSFPAQYYLAKASLDYLGEPYHTSYYKAAIGASSGTLLALAETRLLHPIDSLKVLAQTNPDFFKKNSIRYCYQHFWGSLSAGVGLYMFRSTITNPLSWGARAYTQAKLDHTEINQHLTNVIASFVFSFVRIVLGYPFGTIATQMQFSRTAYATWNDEIKDALLIAKRNGVRTLYTGFPVKGGTQFFASFLRMSLFTWWIQPKQSIPTKIPLHFWKERTHEVLEEDTHKNNFNFNDMPW